MKWGGEVQKDEERKGRAVGRQREGVKGSRIQTKLRPGGFWAENLLKT
jgi:hypothetical protein